MLRLIARLALLAGPVAILAGPGHTAPQAALRVGIPAGHLQAVMASTLLDGTSTRIADPHGRKAGLALVYEEDSAASLACRNGLFAPLPHDTPHCLRPAPALRLALAWDRARMPALAGWSSLWDLARFPGRRSLPRDARGTLEIALLADGVPPTDLYRVLSTQAGVDRAFRRLDQLKPYIVWWTTPAQATALIQDGAVMGCAPAGEILAAARTHPHGSWTLSWSQTLPVSADWAVPARLAAPLGRRIPALLDQVTNPDRLAAFAAAYPQDPPSPVTDTLRLADSTAFWRGHGTALRQRFDTWLASK